MSGPHQVSADVLAGTHQIPGGFIRLTRNSHRRYLSKQRQPSQMPGLIGNEDRPRQSETHSATPVSLAARLCLRISPVSRSIAQLFTLRAWTSKPT
jgi:hypothetical protein